MLENPDLLQVDAQGVSVLAYYGHVNVHPAHAVAVPAVGHEVGRCLLVGGAIRPQQGSRAGRSVYQRIRTAAYPAT
jgi:hypothetical protein